jgi:carboxymethylenebutenolidase
VRTTDRYEGLLAETITVPGAHGDRVHTYSARPLGPGPFPAVVLFHHRPGWDEWYRHATRLFAHHGYLALCPDLYCRVGHGEPDDVAARAQAEGGVPDDDVVADAAACVELLRSHPTSNGKVGYFGTCSGARHAYLAACRGPAVDAVVDCWGGRIVAPADELTEKQPVAPVDLTADLPCPVLGLFGNDDHNALRRRLAAPDWRILACHASQDPRARRGCRRPPRHLFEAPPRRSRSVRHDPPISIDHRRVRQERGPHPEPEPVHREHLRDHLHPAPQRVHREEDPRDGGEDHDRVMPQVPTFWALGTSEPMTIPIGRVASRPSSSTHGTVSQPASRVHISPSNSRSPAAGSRAAWGRG